MALVDVRRELVDVNGAFVSLLGYDRNRLIGQPIRRLVDGGPYFSESEWKAALAEGRHAGEASCSPRSETRSPSSGRRRPRGSPGES